jgi:hypothetical protein
VLDQKYNFNPLLAQFSMPIELLCMATQNDIAGMKKAEIIELYFDIGSNPFFGSDFSVRCLPQQVEFETRFGRNF